jgi:hypothetical protein
MEPIMKRTCASLLVATLLFPNCAARTLPMRTWHAPHGADVPQAPAEVWRRYAEKLPPGSTVKIQTIDGERMTATLLEARDTDIVVKPRTRIPVPARELSYDRLATLDLATSTNGANVLKTAAIGAGIGAGVFMGLLLWAASHWD